MKHIKTFNENKSEELDIEYLEGCFIDFLDLPETYTTELELTSWHIQIFFPKYKVFLFGNHQIKDIGDVIKHNDEIGEVYKDIDVSIKKAKLKYPNIKTDLDFTWNDLNDCDYKTPASISIWFRLE
jgi:hypothetical protein